MISIVDSTINDDLNVMIHTYTVYIKMSLSSRLTSVSQIMLGTQSVAYSVYYTNIELYDVDTLILSIHISHIHICCSIHVLLEHSYIHR